MGWKKIPLWGKALITILSVFILSEVVLRFFGYTGIISNNALNIIYLSSKRLFLLIDNIILFLITITVPAIWASILTRRLPKRNYGYSIKGKGSLETSTIEVKVPVDNTSIAEGKGLIYGSFLAIFYIIFDFFILKKFISECNYFCGIENLFAILFSIAYLIMGIMLKKKKA